MKTIKRTTIIVETREVLLVGGAPVEAMLVEAMLVEGRCAQCGCQVEMIKLEGRAVGENREASRADRSQLVAGPGEMRFIRADSLPK